MSTSPIIHSPIIQGWCPGALRPMMSGDGLVVRVRPRVGRLSMDQAAGLARLAQAHGNGLIDLSARANVQLRGIADAGHPVLIAALYALGLIDETPAAEAARNITVTPLWLAGDGTEGLANDLMALIAAVDFPELPGKFGYAIDTGLQPVLRGISADIRLERGSAGFILRADGAECGAAVTAETVSAAVRDLATWFVASGGITAGRGRMAALIEGGAVLPDRFRSLPVQLCASFAAKPGLVQAGALVGVEFGQMQAETLEALARLGAIRVTPWRMLLIEGARQMPKIPGLITDPDDPMLRVVACTGAPGCLQAHQPTRDLGRALAPYLTQTLHISGCTKGCAHPGPTATTLVATPTGFDLIRHGNAAAMPALNGLSAAEILARPQILTEITT